MNSHILYLAVALYESSPQPNASLTSPPVAALSNDSKAKPDLKHKEMLMLQKNKALLLRKRGLQQDLEKRLENFIARRIDAAVHV